MQKKLPYKRNCIISALSVYHKVKCAVIWLFLENIEMWSGAEYNEKQNVAVSTQHFLSIQGYAIIVKV